MEIKFIVKQFGGLTEMTNILGLKYPSVIQGWIKRGKIPDWRISLVEEKAKELGICLENLGN